MSGISNIAVLVVAILMFTAAFYGGGIIGKRLTVKDYKSDPSYGQLVKKCQLFLHLGGLASFIVIALRYNGM